MGVRGLWTEIKRGGGPFVRCPEGAVLIDFHAWLFWFLDSLLPGASRTAEQFLATAYSDVTRLVDCWVATLEAQGLHPEFIVDGKAATGTKEEFETKIETWKSRRSRIYKLHAQIRDLINIGVNSHDPTALQGVELGQPFPKLGFVIRRHLKLSGYYLYCCNGEADKVIDIIFEHFSRRPQLGVPEVQFVVTNDTDIVLMPHAQVLLLLEANDSPLWRDITRGTLDLFRGVVSEPVRLTNRSVRLRSADRLAKQFNLSCSDLPGFALLRGNDYTAHVSSLVFGPVRNANNLLRCLTQESVEIVTKGERFSLENTRQMKTIPGWTRDHEDAYNFLCRFYRVIETREDRAVAMRVAKDYERSRLAIYAIRGKCDLENSKIFTMETAQHYAKIAESDFEFCQLMQRLELPSFILSILSPNRTHFGDIVYDDFNSIQSKEPLPLFTLGCRKLLYGFLLQHQPREVVTEWWATTHSHSDQKTVTQAKINNQIPALRQMPSLSDARRLELYLQWLCPNGKLKVHQAGMVACALAKLYELGKCFGDAAVVAAMLTAQHTQKKWRALLPIQCLERRLGIICPRDRLPMPTSADFTLSEPGNYLIMQDYDLLKIPHEVNRELEVPPVFSSVVEYIEDLLESQISSKRLPRTRRVLPSSQLITVWSRLADYYDHLVWAQSAFLLCENASVFMEFFLDFHLFVLVYICLNPHRIGQFFVDPKLRRFVIPKVEAIVRRIVSNTRFHTLRKDLALLRPCLP